MIDRRMALSLAILLLLAFFPEGLAAQDDEGALSAINTEELGDFEEYDDLVVVSRGRMKPFAIHAREELIYLFGKSALDSRSPEENYLRLLFARDEFFDAPWFTAGSELADALFDGRRSLSATEVVDARDRMVDLVTKAQALADSHRSGDEVDKDRLKSAETLREQIMDLFGRVNRMRDPLADLRYLPDPTSSSGEWLNHEEARAFVSRGHDLLRPGVEAFEKLEKSFLSRDAAAFRASVYALMNAQRAVTESPDVNQTLLTPGMVRLELIYYAVDFKIVGLIVFALAGLFFLAQAVSLGASRPPGRVSRGLGRAASGVMILGILWNCWIIAGHTAIAGRLPLKNLQEVYLVVLFFVPLIGLLLELILKSRVYSAMSTLLTVVGFTGSLFLDPQGYMIAPLVAILQSPWRQVHILTIMLSYAILLVAFGLHAAYLCRVAFVRSAPDHPDALALDLDRKAYLLVAWGFLFLTIGISTGAAWGHSSWGRYWGWDPKEVWATVAWAIYALFLHLRIFFRAPRWLLALINIVGYAAILFTYFGVTYLLPGLHAYK